LGYEADLLLKSLTTIKKIERLGLVEYFETLSHNLSVFFDLKKAMINNLSEKYLISTLAFF